MRTARSCPIIFKGDGMQRYISSVVFQGLVIMLVLGFSGKVVSAVDSAVCSSGTGMPPFLSAGTSPNLLLMIDNSGSMLDMANIGTASTACTDNSFDTIITTTSTQIFAGLFDPAQWYQWDSATGAFKQLSTGNSLAAARTAFQTSPGTEYSQQYLFVKINEHTATVQGNGNQTTTVTVQDSVSAFAASGNFLNWASASKMDIEKKILTGGKFALNDPDKPANVLVSEGRGCSGSNFIKEAGVQKVTYNTNGTTTQTAAKITFSINGGGSSSDDTTRISILGTSQSGFIGSSQLAACQAAITEFGSSNPNQGVISQNTATCLSYPTQQNIALADSNAAYNHSIHECWYTVKAPGSNTPSPSNLNPTDTETACQKVYTDGVSPSSIDPSDSGYVCSQKYVGRCWTSSGAWTTNPTGITIYPKGGGNQTYSVADSCVMGAMWDYCQSLKIPEVIDPTNNLLDTNNTWGMVGALVDASVAGLFGTDTPLIIMKGYIKLPVDSTGAPVIPTGKIQEYKDKLRMGAMAFNYNGADYECKNFPQGGTIVKQCPNTPGTNFQSTINYGGANYDGAQVVASIMDSGAPDHSVTHIDYLVTQVNAIPATSWTPLAEGLYDALGYYGQNPNLRLNTSDFTISTSSDPVQSWCQANNILLITEGASSADINKAVSDWVTAQAPIVIQNANSQTPAVPINGYTFTSSSEGECTQTSVQPINPTNTTNPHYLYGSTYLNDLTFFGYHADLTGNTTTTGIYAQPTITTTNNGVTETHKKQNITTYLVKTGNPNSANTGDCNPATLMDRAAQNGSGGAFTNAIDGTTPDQLNKALDDVLSDILSRASAGSAASVISSSRSGEGAIYQAIFWPQSGQGTNQVTWVGDVHGLFIDDSGFMYEDTNTNRTFNPTATSTTAADQKVFTYYDSSMKQSMACGHVPSIQPDGTEVCKNPTTGLDEGKSFDKVKFLWSAKDWLSGLTDVASDRGVQSDGTFDFTGGRYQRYIFTWNDLDHNGIVHYGTGATDPTNEVVAFKPDTSATPKWNPDEFNVTSIADVNNVIAWVRGQDFPATFRSRQAINSLGTAFTWRLGDIIHSTPQTVTAPAEGYHLLYNDSSYASFVSRYKTRRNVVYFGANDGMLHAVNAGFYNSTLKKFCLSMDANGNCPANDTGTGPDLGAELWAYVPYNLHPHLKCLTDKNYDHKYYVDLKPRVFDVQIFTPDTDHVNGWGTILVGGLGFGGAPTNATYTDNGTKIQKYISSYFILDITNPEKPPVLLGELTQGNDNLSADLGYSTVIPTMVIAKQGLTSTSTNTWDLIFGSGPHGDRALEGVSDQPAQLAVFHLNGLVGSDNKPVKAFRIPKTSAGATTSGTFSFPLQPDGTSQPYGFVSDPITLDFDINPSSNGQYVSDAVYFGTVEGDFGTCSGKTCWKGGSHLFRLVMEPSGHTIQNNNIITTANSWQIKPLIDLSTTNQPITAAPSVGTDGYNYWIYFGTGRFFDVSDKTDTQQQSFYGIKEPLTVTTTTDVNTKITSTVKTLTWKPVSKLPDLTSNGLLRVDQMQVAAGNSGSASVSCRSDAPNCLPSEVNTFDTLENYIAGTKAHFGSDNRSCSTAPGINCVDGWYKDFYPQYSDGQKNLGQATLLGGLVTFTTFQPFSDPCKSEGNSFLYAVHYQTGTSYYKNIFGTVYGLDGIFVKNQLGLGKGLTTTPNLFTGQGKDAGGVKAFIQTSTGEIKEIEQDNLPINNYKTGRDRWMEYQRP